MSKETNKIIEEEACNMRVLSLFDGIAGAYQALKEANILISKYYASEIDDSAVKIAMKNHSDIIQLGDITKINWSEFKHCNDEIDLLVGGSPCTNLSNCGDRTGLNGEQSKLFYEYVKALKIIKPKYFLLENVASMTKENKDKMSVELDCDCIEINSSLLTAQQRRRVYWTNIPNIIQPEDKKIRVIDILDKNAIELNYINNINGFLKDTSEYYYNTSKRIGHLGKGGQAHRIYSIYGKSVCINANGGGMGGKTGLYYVGNNIVRKLNVLECERLQGFSDQYTSFEGISDSQRYKAIGNSFTVPVITHILKNLTM